MQETDNRKTSEQVGKMDIDPLMLFIKEIFRLKLKSIIALFLAISCGYVAFTTIDNAEHTRYQSHFRSLSNQIVYHLQERLHQAQLIRKDYSVTSFGSPISLTTNGEDRNRQTEPLIQEVITATKKCASEKQTCTILSDLIPSAPKSSSFREQKVPVSVIAIATQSADPEAEDSMTVEMMSLSWPDLLTGLVPGHVCGVEAVLASNTQQFTFSLCGGVASLKCAEDCHQQTRDTDAISTDLDLENGGFLLAPKYTLRVYPGSQFYGDFHSYSPWLISLLVLLSVLLARIITITAGAVAVLKSENVVKLNAVSDFKDNSVVIDSTKLSVEGSAEKKREQRVEEKVDKKADVADSKRKLMRFVSHEIRTPLNTLVLGLNLLQETVRAKVQEEAVKASVGEFVQDLRESCNEAVMVLNDLLQYDTIETKAMRLDLRPIQIWTLLERTVNSSRSSAKDKGISLEVALVDESEVTELSQLGVNGDPFRLSQVINNIITNSLKFAPEDSTVKIKTEFHTQSQFEKHQKKNHEDDNIQPSSHSKWVVFYIEDQGPGISPDSLEAFFSENAPFHPNGLKQCSGLGMWISKGIIGLHGGHFWAESEGEGRGSTFFFELPLVEWEDEDEEDSDEEGFMVSPLKRMCFGSAQTNSRGFKEMENFKKEEHSRGQRVMVVDDVPMCRKMLVRSLEAKGYECVEAGTGKECIDMVEAGEVVHCVLMDFQMPVMTGPAATKVLKERGCAVPVVGVTGNVMTEDVQEFMDAGVDLVLQKPFSMEDFERFMTKKYGK